MGSDFDRTYAAARRAYELGRLRWAALRAVIITVAVALLAALASGTHPLVWLPLPLLVFTSAFWRGRGLLQGALRGLVAGLVTLLLPLSILRPCCDMNAMANGGDCCTMPSACAMVGGLLGASMALLLPKGSGAHRAEAAAGMVLGLGAVAALRCSSLFLAETAGLLGGLVAGLLVTGVTQAWLDRRGAQRA